MEGIRFPKKEERMMNKQDIKNTRIAAIGGVFIGAALLYAGQAGIERYQAYKQRIIEKATQEGLEMSYKIERDLLEREMANA